MKNIKILFVCMGNICRSPTAEGVFRKLVEEQGIAQFLEIDSAGTHAYHVGEAPDNRAQRAARDRNIDLSKQRARKVTYGDFEDFDFILAMDEENLAILTQTCPAQHQQKLHLFLDFAPHVNTREVPDPYYGGSSGFERVLDLCESASEGLLASLKTTHKL